MTNKGCDLRLGDSRLQSVSVDDPAIDVVICV